MLVEDQILAAIDGVLRVLGLDFLPLHILEPLLQRLALLGGQLLDLGEVFAIRGQLLTVLTLLLHPLVEQLVGLVVGVLHRWPAFLGRLLG